MNERRRFSPPWSIEDHGACFMVKAQSAQALASVYCEQEPGRRSAAYPITGNKSDADLKYGHFPGPQH